MPQVSVRGRKAGSIEFVAIGHVSIDRLSSERRLGGAAAYASSAAARLGLAAAAVTSLSDDFPFWSELEGVEVHYRSSRRTTEFENRYRDGAREQRIGALAASLTENELLEIRSRVGDDAAVLYCPIAHELELPFVRLAPRGLAGAAPQGFFRQWDDSGRVGIRDWPQAAERLAGVDVVCLSERDAPLPEELAESFTGTAFVVTRGAAGCRLYSEGDVFSFPAPPARELDPTGAGDVFAAAFLVALRENQPLSRAARFASAAAALSVEGAGLDALPGRDAVESRLRAWRESW